MAAVGTHLISSHGHHIYKQIYMYIPILNKHRPSIGVRMGGAQGGMFPPPKNCIILCSTILLPAMYGSRCICIMVMTHVPPLSFNPTDAYDWPSNMKLVKYKPQDCVRFLICSFFQYGINFNIISYTRISYLNRQPLT